MFLNLLSFEDMKYFAMIHVYFDLLNTCINFQFLHDIDIHRIKLLILVIFHFANFSIAVNLRFLVLFSFNQWESLIGDGCLHFRLVWELVVHEMARWGPQAMCSLSVIYYYSSCSCLS